MEKSPEVIKPVRVYNDAEDKNVAKIVVYANEDSELFYDADFTEGKEVAVADCLNLFLKGVVAVKDGVYYAPVSCTSAGVIDFGFPEA